jgi:hypothetical protein
MRTERPWGFRAEVSVRNSVREVVDWIRGEIAAGRL